MALSRGTRLGPYEILAGIGAGGMGEVYRARDTKLGRDIALKTLPESFAGDPERLQRFKREAHLLASLNHPCIAHIHGLEDSTSTVALIMELVDGPTLAERIARGPIPIEEALPIGKQIAEALEVAHEHGIVHRDLKPANIKVRDDGGVKVLDFGLAKALEAPGNADQGFSTSPTLSHHGTRAGMIVGTAAYMAPEQARGKAVDKRADIWAFGCVLFEMLSGTRAFEGDDLSTTLANVLTANPTWAALPPEMTAGVRRLLSRCLDKDPRQRLRDIGEARIAIDAALSGVVEDAAPAAAARSLWRRKMMGTAAIALIAAAITGSIVWLVARSMMTRPRTWRFQIAPPSAAALTINGLSRDIALTPDGSRVIYIGANGTTLFVRSLDRLEVTPLVRGDALRDPFVSPDGQWVGFFDGPQTLEKVAITGGQAVLVARLDSFEHGATWAADGTIIFATAAPLTGLERVSADGGVPSVLTRPDHAHGEAQHMWPHVLPDGQAVLYTVAATAGGLDTAAIAVLDLRSGRSNILLRGGSDAQFVSSGHLVYQSEGTLRTVRFDPTRLIVVGPTRALVPQVMTTSLGAADVGLSSDGTLVYVAGDGGSSTARIFVWADRQGHETPVAAPPRAYAFPSVSPDGRRIAISTLDQNTDLWLWDLNHSTLTRLTSDPAIDTSAIWTADGRRVVFCSNRAGALNLFSENADGTGVVERLTDNPNGQLPSAVTPDGSQVLFTELSGTTGQDVMVLTLATHKVRPLVQTSFDERNAIVSPDGRWLAYEANDTGAFEIYVQPFPAMDRRWQVSTSGGRQPVWARSGRELFYLAPDGGLIRVEVSGDADWRTEGPVKLFQGRYVVSTAGNFARNYDVVPDGQRFLMIRSAGNETGGGPQIVVIQHVDEELKHVSQ
jgi:Tol biopolymer transport system component